MVNSEETKISANFHSLIPSQKHLKTSRGQSSDEALGKGRPGLKEWRAAASEQPAAAQKPQTTRCVQKSTWKKEVHNHCHIQTLLRFH